MLFKSHKTYHFFYFTCSMDGVLCCSVPTNSMIGFNFLVVNQAKASDCADVSYLSSCHDYMHVQKKLRKESLTLGHISADRGFHGKAGGLERLTHSPAMGTCCEQLGKQRNELGSVHREPCEVVLPISGQVLYPQLILCGNFLTDIPRVWFTNTLHVSQSDQVDN